MVNTPPHGPLSHPGLLTARVISKVSSHKFGVWQEDRQPGYVHHPPPGEKDVLGSRLWPPV